MYKAERGYLQGRKVPMGGEGINMRKGNDINVYSVILKKIFLKNSSFPRKIRNNIRTPSSTIILLFNIVLKF